jgi:hypothetical protein
VRVVSSFRVEVQGQRDEFVGSFVNGKEEENIRFFHKDGGALHELAFMTLLLVSSFGKYVFEAL